MARLAARDQDALAALYARYGDAVYSIALRVLREPAAAEEVTQDVFLDVWRHPTRWAPERGRLISWLLALARYSAIDRLRHDTSRRQPQFVEPPPEERWASPAEPDDAALLGPLIETLPAEQRDLIDLAFFGGMTHSQIAAATGLPLGTVKSRLRAALTRLRELWLGSADAIQLPSHDRYVL